MEEKVAYFGICPECRLDFFINAKEEDFVLCPYCKEHRKIEDLLGKDYTGFISEFICLKCGLRNRLGSFRKDGKSMICSDCNHRNDEAELRVTKTVDANYIILGNCPHCSVRLRFNKKDSEEFETKCPSCKKNFKITDSGEKVYGFQDEPSNAFTKILGEFSPVLDFIMPVLIVLLIAVIIIACMSLGLLTSEKSGSDCYSVPTQGGDEYEVCD